MSVKRGKEEKKEISTKLKVLKTNTREEEKEKQEEEEVIQSDSDDGDERKGFFHSFNKYENEK